MTHLSWRPRGNDLHLDVDFVVVGSGAGGAAAASTLARAGASVCIVEAGAWRDPEHYPDDFYGALRDLYDNWQTTVGIGRSLCPIVQARTVGGTTVINAAICVRTPRDVVDLWSDQHGFDAEHTWRELQRHQDDLERDLSVQLVDEPNAGRHNTLAIASAHRRGDHDHVMRRYAKGCEGTGRCILGCRSGAKQSTNLNLVPEVLTLGGHVLSCAPVRRVMLSGRRAVGVSGHFVHPAHRAKGANFEVRARRAVVMAASATHSPVLLKRSGVRSKALGKRFMAHPGGGVVGIYDDPVDMNHGVTQGWASTRYREDRHVKLETLSMPLEMMAGRLGGGGAQLIAKLAEYRHMAHWVVAVRAEAEGTVRPSLLGTPMVRYSLTRRDTERLRWGLKHVAEQHFEAGATKVMPGIYGAPDVLGPDDLGVLDQVSMDPRRQVVILSHLFGGCVMGTDESRSVCDLRGKVHGYEGLVVADASCIPTTLGVNPQHTIMALARMHAESLLEQRGQA
ncbi:MAG: choline dehydrogenase-like flavoprotein [Kiritimatiellia bacterium]|jgi:choline dehydrogenase-like flavoprotein